MQTKEAIKFIQEMAEKGKPVTASGRALEQSRIFTFSAAPLATRPVDYFKDKDKINSQTVIGKNSRHPITLKIPVVAAALSYGALSLEAKKAVTKGTALVDTADNTGEGGMYPGERELAKILIVQYSTGRFGVTEEYLKVADVVEIKMGQGVKPGQGGLLPGYKVTKAIAKTRSTPERKIKPGETLHSSAYHHDIFSSEDLKKKVKWLRKLTGGKPIIIKLGAGEVEKDIEYILPAQPDIIAIDGREGGTGASPRVMMDGVGIPAIPALVRARRFLDGLKAEGEEIPELWIGGGFNLGEEIAAALALGANVVFLGFSLMIAMGCVYCQKCHLGECKLGIAGQKEKTKKLDVDKASQGVANYLTALTEEVKMIAAAQGLWDIYQLRKEHLRAFDFHIAQKCGIKTIWDDEDKG